MVRALPRTPQFDLAFIDADKPGYLAYWNEVVPRVRPGGAILVDNTFSHGRVIDAGNESELVQAIRDFNDHAAADDRVEVVMLPLGDGLTLARKNKSSNGPWGLPAVIRPLLREDLLHERGWGG